MIRLAVIDDQSIVREALAIMLDLDPDVDVVATATDGAQALAVAAAVRPDVLLIDLTMPVLNGIDAISRIHRDHPDIAILVLTTYAEGPTIRAAFHAGASGYLTKDADRATILRAIRAAVPATISVVSQRASRDQVLQHSQHSKHSQHSQHSHVHASQQPPQHDAQQPRFGGPGGPPGSGP